MATTLLNRVTASTTHAAFAAQSQRSHPTARSIGSRNAFLGAALPTHAPGARTTLAKGNSARCTAAPKQMDTQLEAGMLWPKWQPKLNKPNTWLKDFPEGPAANLVMGALRSQGLNIYKEAEIQAALPRLQRYWNHFSATPIDYPDYYLDPFHVWHGNLNWPAAANSEPVMAFFNFNNLSKEDKATLSDRFDAKGRVVGKVIDEARRLSFAHVASSLEQLLGKPASQVRNIVDMGCGTGRPTRLLAHHFPNAHVIGIDASPHFLSWALLRTEPGFREKELLPEEVVSSRVEFRRALAEHTKLPANSQDAVILPYIAHETPIAAREEMLREAKRILRPGGIVGFVDHNQEGSVGNKIFKKMENFSMAGDVWHAINNFGAPEPLLREYHLKMLEDSLTDTGFSPAAYQSVTLAQRFVAGRK